MSDLASLPDTEFDVPEGPSADDLASIVCDVWNSIGLTAIPDGEGVDVHDARLVTASVSVSGAWEGHVTVHCDGTAGREFAATMLGFDSAAEVEDADFDDAMGELANMVGGNVKAVMPDPSKLTLPRVVFGSFESQRMPLTRPVVETHLSTGHGPVTVIVWQRASAAA